MDLDAYQNLAIGTAIYPGRRSFAGLTYVALKMNGEAGEIAEKVGKTIRDDNSVLLPEKREQLIKELGDVLWYVAAAADELSIDLSFVAKVNLAKLADRKARGALGGSGDNR